MKKRIIMIAAAAALSVLMAFPAFAGTWKDVNEGEISAWRGEVRQPGGLIWTESGIISARTDLW